MARSRSRCAVRIPRVLLHAPLQVADRFDKISRLQQAGPQEQSGVEAQRVTANRLAEAADGLGLAAQIPVGAGGLDPGIDGLPRRLGSRLALACLGIGFQRRREVVLRRMLPVIGDHPRQADQPRLQHFDQRGCGNLPRQGIEQTLLVRTSCLKRSPPKPLGPGHVAGQHRFLARGEEYRPVKGPHDQRLIDAGGFPRCRRPFEEREFGQVEVSLALQGRRRQCPPRVPGCRIEMMSPCAPKTRDNHAFIAAGDLNRDAAAASRTWRTSMAMALGSAGQSNIFKCTAARRACAWAWSG